MSEAADRIQKLLDKAARTDNEHEAEAFNDAAARLMVKYAIDQEALDQRRKASGHAGEQITTSKLELRGTYARSNVDLLCWAAGSMGLVEAYYTKRSNSHFTMTFVGYEGDVEQMLALAASLVAQCDSAMRRFKASHLYPDDERRVVLAETRMFRRGFANGVSHKIEVSKRSVTDAEPGTALVLASRLDRVKASMADTKIKVVLTREIVGSRTAHTAGFVEGRDNTDIGQTRVTDTPHSKGQLS